jgi:uncharacterized cupin superfamily protein
LSGIKLWLTAVFIRIILKANPYILTNSNGDFYMPTIKDVVVKKPTDEEIETCKSLPIWQGDVSTFDWDYTQTETCLIIEGKVTVTDRPACEDSVTFGAGDMVVFPVGLACIWKIEEAVRKYYEFS